MIRLDNLPDDHAEYILEWARQNPEEHNEFLLSIQNSEKQDQIFEAIKRDWLGIEFDDDGEELFVVREGNNPFWYAHMRAIEAAIGILAEEGLVDIVGVDEGGNIVYEVTDRGQQLMDVEA